MKTSRVCRSCGARLRKNDTPQCGTCWERDNRPFMVESAARVAAQRERVRKMDAVSKAAHERAQHDADDELLGISGTRKNAPPSVEQMIARYSRVSPGQVRPRLMEGT